MATTKNPAVLWNVEQVLTSAEQTQARENIGFPTATASGQVLVYGTSTTIEWGKFLVKNVGTPTWNDLNRSGFYNIANSQTAGTDNSPENGAVSLLAGSTGGEPGQFTTQFVMGSDLFYRTKPANGSWNEWRELVTQYKDTITSAVSGFKFATTNVGSTVGDKTHYTALVNITPNVWANTLNEPYLAYLEIYQERMPSYTNNDTQIPSKDNCVVRLKMLSTPSSADYSGFTPFVIRGSNASSSGGNCLHDWYICRSGGDTINNLSITVTPLLTVGEVTYRGITRASSVSTVDAYIITGESTPGVTNASYALGGETGRPVYVSSSGVLTKCNTTALSKTVNGTYVGNTSTPIYINSNGKPTECIITTGTGSSTVPSHSIIDHMYTAVSIANNNSINRGGASTTSGAVSIIGTIAQDNTFTATGVKFPSEYIPNPVNTGSWPAGIIIFVNVSAYIVNSTADFVDIDIYQDSTSLSNRRYNILPNYSDYLTATFSAITVAPITSSTVFQIKVNTPGGAVGVHFCNYALTALI